MKIKNGNVAPALRSVVQLSSPSTELPMSGAVKVRDLFRSLKARETTIGEVQQSLFEKYGEKDESGKLKTVPSEVDGQVSVQIKPEFLQQFAKEFGELLDVEVDADPFLTPDDLPAKINAGILIGLGDLFVVNPGPKAV